MNHPKRIGLKATKTQRALSVYLSASRALILWLLRNHRQAAEIGYTRHPCWAGGFSENEGIVSQPCDACDPFSEEEQWALALLKKDLEERR